MIWMVRVTRHCSSMLGDTNMDTDGIITTIIASFGGATALLGLLSLLFTKLLELRIERSASEYRSAMERQNQMALAGMQHENTKREEALRHELSLENQNTGFAYAKIYEKRMEVLDSLYKRMVEMHGQITYILDITTSKGDAGEEAMRTFYGKLHEFGNYYLLNKLYLPEETVELIEKLASTARYNVWKYAFAQRRQDGYSGHPTLMDKAFADEDAARKAFKEDIPVIMENVEKHFRKALKI